MNEDFVSFELANKLKEKGFREKCLAYYDAEDNVGLLYNTQYSIELLPCQYTDLLASYNSGDIAANLDTSDNCIDAPTISQVLKWLREEHGISLNIYPSHFANLLYWTCDVLSFIGEISIEKRLGGDVKTYEEVAIYGIEYVLDNLI